MTRIVTTKMKHRLLISSLSCIIAAAVISVANAADRVDFSHDVVPVLKKHCVACHGGDEAEGGFSLNTRALILDAEAAQPGKASKSRIMELVASSDPDEQMPPKDKPRLTAREIALLEAWIDQGLTWEDGFSFASDRYEPPLQPRRPDLPPVVDGRTNPIDRILDAYYAEHEVALPPRLDDAAFMRRLHLDVIGLPPHPDRLAKFVDDPSSDKRERLVQQVLGFDQQYAEHWMTFWNDLLRNAYSGTGFIDGGREQITGWLYRSLLENKPYDQFVQELIAPTAESEGFIRGIKWRGNVNASQTREIQFAQSVSQVLLGINMKCASCHDSFIDRWTLKDAYGLAAIYANGPLEIFRCDKPTGEFAKPGWIFSELGEVDSDSPQPARLKQLASLITHPENGRLTRTIVNRIWLQFMGRGIVHPVDAMHTEPWSSDLQDHLAVFLADEEYDLKKLIELIATSRAYQSRATVMPEEVASDKYVFQGPLVKRMTAEQFLDTIWTVTGTFPAPDSHAFKIDGRRQGGQLAAVLQAHGSETQWKDRPVRAVFTPLDSLQASLGRPNREQVVTTRPDQLTTLEAINLANGETLAATLARGAANLQQREFASSEAMVQWLYAYALSRQPTADERELAAAVLGESPAQQDVEDLLWMVFMLPEFQFIR